MKSTALWNFKQIYIDKETQEQKENFYQVTIIKDTEGYNYRILNVTSGTLWKDYRFKTFKQAEEFLNNHPHSIGNSKEITLNRLY